MWRCGPFPVGQRLTQHFCPIFQFDLPFVEVHRVKAVRFSLPPSKEEEEYETIGEPGSATSEAETGCAESESRTGSQTHLTEKSSRRERSAKQTTPDSLLCGLGCAAPPSVSAWNCDGEILPVTELFCRWDHTNYSQQKHKNVAFGGFFVGFFLTSLNTSCQDSWPVVTSVCPGHRGPVTAQL